jgi:hydrogenase maturation factor HypF (carbamoyltransferase family)
MAFSHLLAAGFDVESREILSLLDEAGEGDDESGHDLAEGSVEQSSLDGMVSSRPVESGHGFSRAEKGQKGYRALAPAGVQSAQTAQSFHRERSTSFNQVRVIRRMIDRNLNSPLTSSGGRLFDAAAAIILGRHAVDYEAQAAIELEGLAIDEPDDLPPYELEITSGDWPARTPATILAAPMWRRLIGDLRSGTPPPRIAARFHSGVAHAFSQAAVLARVATCINQVALSGGCLHNRRLARLLRRELEREGFEVFAHRSVSPGDGGLSYGQAVIGAAILTT